MTLRDALDRTLLLMRDEIHDEVDDDTLLATLTGTRVVVIGDAANLDSHAAKTAFATVAMLMARSGHTVHIIAPEMLSSDSHPLLSKGTLIKQLVMIGIDILPGVSFTEGPPSEEADLAIAIGNSQFSVAARRRIRMNADAWAGYTTSEVNEQPWKEQTWPLGGMASATLAASEAFKIAMSKLRLFARNTARIDTVFLQTDEQSFCLAPPETARVTDLGFFDCVSGGTIIHAIFYALLQIPGVTGKARIVEHDISGISNLNRYMLLLRSRLGLNKANDLTAILDVHGGIKVEPVPMRYENEMHICLEPFAPRVLVGVDDIPTRWEVQRAKPAWLGIGATTHWSAMASFHRPGLGCAQCLHPTGEHNDVLIPTVAFVSFWAGLLTAASFLRHLAQNLSEAEQQIYLTCLRPENPMRSRVAVSPACPTCGDTIATAPQTAPQRAETSGIQMIQ